MGARTSPLCPAGSLSARDNEDPESGVASTSPVCKVLPTARSGSFTHRKKGEGENLSQHIMTCPGEKTGSGGSLIKQAKAG